MSTPTYLVLDTEATGFYPNKYGLIQVAAVICDEKLKVLDSFDVDINPGNVKISDEALKITGFTLERIKNGLSTKEFCEKFLEFLQKYFSSEKKPILVAQFFPFDFAHLQALLVASGFEFMIQDFLQNDFIDTKVLVNFANLLALNSDQKIPFVSTSLSKPGGLKEVLQIPASKFVAHDAMGDVLATLEVLQILVNKFDFKLF